MSGADVTISCPHCQRQYTMKIDPERLMRLKTRATCGRCGNTFDAASRIVPASEATTDPKLPRIDVAPSPAASLVPKASPLPTVPDLRDEMEELAREFAEAAARFTPIAAKRPAAVLTTPPTSTAAPEPAPSTSTAASEPALSTSAAPSEPAPSTSDAAPEPPPPTSAAPASNAAETPPSSPSPPSVVATVEEPTQPGVKHVAVAASAVAASPADFTPSVAGAPPVAVAAPPDVAPSASDVAAAYDELSLEAPPAADDEFAASPPTQSRAPAPLGWLELADRGLSALESPPSPGAAALEALLGESETLALPPTPAAS